MIFVKTTTKEVRAPRTQIDTECSLPGFCVTSMLSFLSGAFSHLNWLPEWLSSVATESHLSEWSLESVEEAEMVFDLLPHCTGGIF